MQVGPNIEKQERTKKRIKDVFMKLYSKYPLEKISMRQIADLAGVTRSTVYVYFDSVYDILEVIEQELQAGFGTYFESYSDDMKNSSGIETENTQIYEESMERWFAFCKENRNYLVILLGPNGDPSFEYKLRKKLKIDLNRMMDEDGMLNDHIRKYALEYLAGAIISLVRYWLECDDDVSVEEITKMANVIRYARGTLQDMIQDAAQTTDTNKVRNEN